MMGRYGRGFVPSRGRHLVFLCRHTTAVAMGNPCVASTACVVIVAAALREMGGAGHSQGMGEF